MLKSSDDPTVIDKFCTMDFKVIQRIYFAIDSLVSKINDDVEVFSLRVDDAGSYNIHLIAQTYIVRIMQEVRRITEYAPLITFIKTKPI